MVKKRYTREFKLKVVQVVEASELLELVTRRAQEGVALLENALDLAHLARMTLRYGPAIQSVTDSAQPSLLATDSASPG